MRYSVELHAICCAIAANMSASDFSCGIGCGNEHLRQGKATTPLQRHKTTRHAEHRQIDIERQHWRTFIIRFDDQSYVQRIQVSCSLR